MLVRLTASKATTNSCFRWVAFFLPTLSAAFGATTAQLTAVLGVGEMAGLSSLAIGRHLDRGRERVVLLAALALTAAGSLLALVGSFGAFAVAYFGIMLGVSFVTVGGHTYLSRRVRYARRARAIGLFETSWALALLIGAPTAALLIGWFGWRGPFVFFAFASALMLAVLFMARDDSVVLDDVHDASVSRRITASAWLLIASSAAIAITGLTTVVIAGTWLDEVLGVSTGGVGLVAMAFGGAELMASSSSAAVADRAGPKRATQVALVVTLLGLLVMTRAGTSLVVGALGLFLFFIGFEFSIVTSFSFVSEALPAARGRVLAVNNAIGTLLRGVGVAMSGVLYERFGINGPVALSATTAVTAFLLLAVAGRPDPGRRADPERPT
ncbi:MAG: MFS transporter [Acidimicrobiia bacterium]|nr:MFS transporter [Acidimicrobiia bacterium]